MAAISVSIRLARPETATQLNNTVKFSTADLHGLKLGAMYGFSNQAGAFAGSSPTTTPVERRLVAHLQLWFHYNYGKLGLTGDLHQHRQSERRDAGLHYQPSRTSTRRPNKDLWTLGFGLRYDFGSRAGVRQLDRYPLIPLTGRSSVLTTYEVGGRYSFTPALSLALGDSYSGMSGGIQRPLVPDQQRPRSGPVEAH